MSSVSETASINADSTNLVLYRKWLNAADKLITQSSLEILKLGFVGDKCELPGGLLDSAKTTNEIFNVLIRCYNGNYEKAAQRFIYSLKRLGHRRHGFACARLYKEKVGTKPPSKYDTRSENQEFGLCQCFMDICVAIDSDAADVLIKYCSRPLLNTAPENIPSLPHMLKTMYQMGLITTSDQSTLAAALKIAGANNCIEYIHKYRDKYELLDKLIVTDAIIKDLRSKTCR